MSAFIRASKDLTPSGEIGQSAAEAEQRSRFNVVGHFVIQTQCFINSRLHAEDTTELATTSYLFNNFFEMYLILFHFTCMCIINSILKVYIFYINRL